MRGTAASVTTVGGHDLIWDTLFSMVGRWSDRIRWTLRLLVLGLATTVLVAFVGPLWVRADRMIDRYSVHDPTVTRFGSSFWSATSLPAPLTTSPPAAAPSAKHTALERWHQARSQTFRRGYPPFEALRVEPDDRPVRWWRIVESGWPLSSFWGWRTLVQLPRGVEWEDDAGLVEVGMLRAGPCWQEMLELPLLPVWEGILGNALVFALAWWAVLIGPLALRRVRRRRRGRCAACGYDLRGLSTDSSARCPECGTRRGGAGGLRPVTAFPGSSGVFRRSG